MNKPIKAKKCRQCKAEFIPRVNLQRVCSLPCALEYSRRPTKQRRSAAEALQRKKDRDAREALKPKAKWLSEAQSAFNSFIRVRDSHLPCVSCSGKNIDGTQGWKVGGAWDAGHYRSRGAASHLRFNTFNVHKQCKSCNGGSGNWGHTGNKTETITQAYRETLVQRIGLDRVERLEQDNQPRTFTVDYLKRVKAIFNRRARHYKKLREHG